MGKITTVSLGDYYQTFVEKLLKEGRYKNTSEVIHAGLRLLEQEENKIADLRAKIKEGLDSDFDDDFDPGMFKEEMRRKL
ncbi:MAG: type II toxin-antitoxin system ParD family antitoxin [Cyclobacteriaceae bacterium]